MLRRLERFGTTWPVPSAWTESTPGVFEGAWGIFQVEVGDGDLIDPARCRAAGAAKPGTWRLVRTVNGVMLAGAYTQAGAHVLVYAVRPDERDLATTHDLPEVQATYVLVTPEAETQVAAIRKELSEIELDANTHGTLDVYGHAAHGPVPVPGAWLEKPGELEHVLVGGGFVMFSDPERCCGVALRPLAWREVSPARIETELASERAFLGLDVSVTPGASVFGRAVSADGHGYVARDARGAIRLAGAIWRDAFGQAWRLHYWFDARHDDVTTRLLGQLSMS